MYTLDFSQQLEICKLTDEDRSHFTGLFTHRQTVTHTRKTQETFSIKDKRYLANTLLTYTTYYCTVLSYSIVFFFNLVCLIQYITDFEYSFPLKIWYKKADIMYKPSQANFKSKLKEIQLVTGSLSLAYISVSWVLQCLHLNFIFLSCHPGKWWQHFHLPESFYLLTDYCVFSVAHRCFQLSGAIGQPLSSNFGIKLVKVSNVF